MAGQGKRGASQGAGEGGKDADIGMAGVAGSFAEGARQQTALAAEMVSAMFRASESLQQAQLHMGQRAALLHQQAAENIRKANSPMEIMSVQSTLLSYQWQEALRYWQEFTMAAGRAGTEILRPSTRAQQKGVDRTGAAAESAPSAAATMVGAAMNAAAPMVDAFQQMFTAPLKTAEHTQAH
jgi:hypothetical protein